MSTLRIALAQVDVAWHDRPGNLARAEALVARAASRGARLLVLPEMFAVGFTMDAAQADPHDGPTAAWAREVAARHDVALILGVPEVPAPGAEGDTPSATPPPDRARPLNVAMLVRPDGGTERYAKTHLFSFSAENAHYRSGDRIVTWNIDGVRVTPLICYDLRFPEPFRLAADDTDLFVVIASWPERRAAHWRLLLRARAVENQAWVAGVNRVGTGDGLAYRGDSALIDPWGEVHAEAAEQEALLVLDVDASGVTSARAAFPPLRDRRSDLRR
jgi:predicted amidohydrolase